VLLKKEGANRGAVTSFVIATPESSVDSISVTWALLDPVMTVVRPICAFVMAVVAGLGVNFLERTDDEAPKGGTSCAACCQGSGAGQRAKRPEFSLSALASGMVSLWGDISTWFFAGVVAAGVITALVPSSFLEAHFGGGPGSMFLMLAAGIPLYICATASTPLAAALILKGASPGAALVLMLTGPATNITAISSLFPIIGRRAVVIYLMVIAGFAVLFGLGVDWLYDLMGTDLKSVALAQAQRLPEWVKWICALLLLSLSAFIYAGRLINHRRAQGRRGADEEHNGSSSPGSASSRTCMPGSGSGGEKGG
jgi:uncharacterized membrane protein YraQ (UPF0718 family)